MELHDLSQIAETAGLSLSLTRYYRDRFIMFVPSVRVGRSVLYPPQAVEVMQTIDHHAKAGRPAGDIEAVLENAYPVTVICSQEVPTDGLAPDAFSAIRALAAELDRRGSRVEERLGEIRQQVDETVRKDDLRAALAEVSTGTAPTPSQTDGISELRFSIDELRSHVSMLASREQLEWIGDVVAAAALRPVVPNQESASDKAFAELMDEMKRANPARDVAELRSAVAKLVEDVNRRDAEFGKAFRTLVGALKQELGTLRGAVRDVQTSLEADINERVESAVVTAAAAPPTVQTPPAPVYTGPTAVLPTTDQLNADILGTDAMRSRAPRRLGQPIRPVELIPSDIEAAPGAD